MGKAVKWAAQLEHVQEVSLRGSVDPAYWFERLKAEDLRPIERDGRAEVRVIACESKFMGIRFRELSFAVSVVAPAGEGVHLERAFNTSRFLAFCERAFFSTPYLHADVAVSLPGLIKLSRGRQVEFRAELGRREPARRADDRWEGPVFVGRGKFFVARLLGETAFFAFDSTEDLIEIRPDSEDGVLQALVDSRFVPEEWMVRADAVHAKSKTYRWANSHP